MSSSLIRDACRRGDVAEARSQLVALQTSMEEDVVREVLLARPLRTSLLHVAAQEQQFEVCKWLLSNECRVLWPGGKRLSYVMDALDYALSAGGCAGGVHLCVVRFLVNQMRHKKGKYRENYVLRLGGIRKRRANDPQYAHQYDRLSANDPQHDPRLTKDPQYDHRLILTSAPVVRYLVEVSREFCLKQIEPYQSLAYRNRVINNTILGLISCEGLQPLDMRLAQTLAERMNTLNLQLSPSHFSETGIGQMTDMHVCVALLAGWLLPSWELLARFLYWQIFTGHVGIIFLIDTLAAGGRGLCKRIEPLQESQGKELLRVAMVECGANPMLFRRVFVLIQSFFDQHTFHNNLLVPLVHKTLSYTVHNVCMTLVTMEAADELSADDAALVVTRSVESISSAVFYALVSRVHLEPEVVTTMLTLGSKTLVQTVVWEVVEDCDEAMDKLLIRMEASSAPYRSIRQRVRWMREMYTVRTLLKDERRRQPLPTAPTQLLTPDGRPIPRRAALNILGLGWLGDFMKWPRLADFYGPL
jgi:hypothetical protein